VFRLCFLIVSFQEKEYCSGGEGKKSSLLDPWGREQVFFWIRLFPTKNRKMEGGKSDISDTTFLFLFPDLA
jgi:hypothetical protein